MTKEEMKERLKVISDKFVYADYISENDRKFMLKEIEILKTAQSSYINNLINDNGIGKELEDELSTANPYTRKIIVNYLESVAFKSKGCADGENAMALLEKYNLNK